MIIIPANPVVYRGTITGLRISSVDGTAFLDNCAALVPYADGLHRVEIYDSAGRQLVGYLSAQGAGETLGEEQLTSWSNFAGYYETFETTGKDITLAINTSGIGIGETNALALIGQLIKATNTVTVNSGDGPTFYYEGLTEASLGAAHATYYITTNKNGCRFRIYNATASSYSSMSTEKIVLTPSTDGCTIVSAKSGAVPNFALVTSGFTFNATSYTVIVRKVR